MPNSSAKEVTILKYALYVLILVLSSITMWNALTIIDLPNTFVRLERYKEDMTTNRDSLKRIENKLDQLISKE